ncbi:MAG: glutathionylspermidine synthase family protein [Bacteroidota bacterium]
MDDRLHDVKPLKERWLRKQNLDYYGTGDNHDYLADEALELTRAEADATLRAGDEAYDLLRASARKSLQDTKRRQELGIPDFALPLLEWSVLNEWDNFLFGRFDFAGGVNGVPLRLLEFNADTASLLPETTALQPEIIRKAGLRQAPNELVAALTENCRRLGGGRRDTATVATHLGSEDDHHNTDVLVRAATAAGWGRVDNMQLPNLILNPDEGVFFEVGPERFIHYGSLIKFFPWDFAALEEPELFEYLTELVMSGKLRVFNPAWTMLLQSKALLTHVWRDNPGNPLLLPAGMVPEELPTPLAGYVRKPIFGRMGENVAIIRDGRTVVAENQGDYGQQPMVYQQLAQFALDEDGYRYQLSSFQAPRACALCCRRQEDLILDDDGEFVALAMR